MDDLVEAVITYSCMNSQDRVIRARILQYMYDGVYREAGEKWKITITGSLFEGMPRVVCGDRDFMVTHRLWPTVHTQPTTSDTTDTPAILSTPRTAGDSAYCRITAHVTSGKLPAVMAQNLSLVGGELYLNSEKFVQSLVGDTKELDIHGPAGTGVIGDGVGAQVDVVYCLQAEEWPPQVLQNFCFRNRRREWPLKAVMDKIARSPCYLVPVGHQKSLNKHIEWRWSFSVAEKQIIHSFTENMHASMFILKSIKKNSFRADSNLFNSYTLKTSCLWVFEKIGQSKTVTSYCLRILRWLRRRFREGFVPHYFLPEQNILVQSSESHRHDVDSVLSWLSRVRTRFHEFALYSLDHDEATMRVFRTINSTNPAPYCIKNICEAGTKGDLPKIIQRSAWIKLYEDTILNNPQLQQTLQHACVTLRGPGFSVRFDLNRGRCMDMLNLSSLHRDLDKLLQSGTSRQILSYAEDVILPITYALTDDVTDCAVVTGLYARALLRHMGDIYGTLHLYYRYAELSDERDRAMEYCKSKVIVCYLHKAALHYTDGFTDKGLNSYVRLALFYYFNNMKDELRMIWDDLKLDSLLRWGSSSENVNRFAWIRVRVGEKFNLLPWSHDIILSLSLRNHEDEYMDFSPVGLGFYIAARLAVTDGVERAARGTTTIHVQDALKSLNNIEDNLSDASLKISTGELSEIIRSVLHFDP